MSEFEREFVDGEVVEVRRPADVGTDDGWGVESVSGADRPGDGLGTDGAEQAHELSSDAEPGDSRAELDQVGSIQRSAHLDDHVEWTADNEVVRDGQSDRSEEHRQTESLRSDSNGASLLEGDAIDPLIDGDQDLAQRSGEVSERGGDDMSSPAPPHRDALREYTGIGHYELNTTLRESSIERIQDLASRSAALTEALERMPAHEGTVFRGSSTILDAAAIARYEPGERVVEDQYLSSTIDPNVEFGGNVLWIIDSRSGREIETESSVEQEREVLFDRFAVFDVLAKDYDDELGRWVIYMVEA